MIVNKQVYRVVVTEEVRFIREVFVSAWSESDARQYVNELYEDGDERVECDMRDWDDLTYRHVRVEETHSPRSARLQGEEILDTGMLPPDGKG